VTGSPGPYPVQLDHISFNLEDEKALEVLRTRIEAAGSEVTEVVEHAVMRSIYFTDPNGIALQASYWVVDGTGREFDAADGNRFLDPDPVPAFAELTAGSVRTLPTTTLVYLPRRPDMNWVSQPHIAAGRHGHGAQFGHAGTSHSSRANTSCVGSNEADIEQAAREISVYYNYFAAWFKNEKPVSQGLIERLTEDELSMNPAYSPQVILKKRRRRYRGRGDRQAQALRIARLQRVLDVDRHWNAPITSARSTHRTWRRS
jgi:hypothetical protein